MPKEIEAVAENKNVVKVGTIELEKNLTNDKFIPPATVIVDSIHDLETIALGIRENLPVLLIGDTGTGKTSFIRHLASLTNNGFRRLNLNGSTTIEELNGHYTADDKAVGLRWIDGILPEAMKNGYWLLLDELNASLPEILFVLQSVLDDDKFLVLPEHEGEIIRPHKDFRIFATMNPSLEYAGTKDLNKALLSRFPIVIQTQYPDAVREMEIIRTHSPKTTDKEASLMVRVAEEIRKGKANSSLSFICSTRELINWAKLSQFMPIEQAVEIALLNKVELPSDKKTVEDIIKLQVGKWTKKQLMTISEIEAQIEQSKIRMKELENVDDKNSVYVKLLDKLRAELEKSKAKAKNPAKAQKLIDEITNTFNS